MWVYREHALPSCLSVFPLTRECPCLEGLLGTTFCISKDQWHEYLLNISRWEVTAHHEQRKTIFQSPRTESQLGDCNLKLICMKKDWKKIPTLFWPKNCDAVIKSVWLGVCKWWYCNSPLCPRRGKLQLCCCSLYRQLTMELL